MARYKVGQITVDVAASSVEGPTDRIELFPQTFALLVDLIRQAPNVCMTNDLVDSIWPDGFVGDQNLKQRVYQLRQAVSAFGVEITTVRGFGYRLDSDVAVIRRRDDIERDSNARADYHRAQALVDGMEHGKAAAILEQVVVLEPEWVAARSLLTWSYMWIGRPDAAKNQLRTALELAGSSSGSEVSLLKGMHASFAGDATEAIDRFELALEDDPDGYWLRISLMGLYWLVGRDDAAAALLADLETLRPGFYLNAWQRGFHRLLTDGDLSAASDAFAEVARLNPDLPLPLAELMPAMTLWGRGELTEALDRCDAVLDKRLGSVPVIGADQLLTFRSRLLADLGDIEAACHDQRRAIDLFDRASPWAQYHRLELALLEGVGPADPGCKMLIDVAESSSSLLATQAHGWLGIEAARASDAAAASQHRRAFASIEYDKGWEWGYPTRPGFDRAQGTFALVIGGYGAMARGDFETADRQFGRALRAAPQRWQVVPVVSLDGRAHIAAREGVALVAAALGDQRRATEADVWILDHPLETVMLAQAGSEYRRRAAARQA